MYLAAPGDASLLAAGTNGYALGLNPKSLKILWATSLPKAGYETVSVFCTQGSVYAGSNEYRYVYRLDSRSGTIQTTNGLLGEGKFETRLGITSVLLVGLHGSAYGMDPESLVTKWTTRLPSSGKDKDVTSVVGGSGVPRPRVPPQREQRQGGHRREHSLQRTGENEVRLVLEGSTGKLLFAGTNGYGVCMRSGTLVTVYVTKLPDSGPMLKLPHRH